jgi:hypothetical protein
MRRWGDTTLQEALEREPEKADCEAKWSWPELLMSCGEGCRPDASRLYHVACTFYSTLHSVHIGMLQ